MFHPRLSASPPPRLPPPRLSFPSPPSAPAGGRKNPRGDFIQIDTTNILFICGGAFVDLESQVTERLSAASIGFGNPVRARKGAGAGGAAPPPRSAAAAAAAADRESGSLKHVEQSDLISYGLIPEFVGRFPVVAPLEVGGGFRSR